MARKYLRIPRPASTRTFDDDLEQVVVSIQGNAQPFANLSGPFQE